MDYDKIIKNFKIIKKIKDKHKIRFIIIIITFLMFLNIVIFLMSLSIRNNNLEIYKNNIKSENFLKNKYVFLGKNINSLFFINNNSLKLNINDVKLYENNKQKLINVSFIINDIYQGKTDIITLDCKNETFIIKNKCHIKNLKNKNEYFITENIQGNFNHDIFSNKPFYIKNKNISLYGQQYNFSNKKKILYIKKMNLKIKFGKNFINIKSDKAKIYIKNKKILLENNVELIFDKNKITSNNLYIFFDEKFKINDIVVKNDKIKIKYDNINIYGKYIYFDIQNQIFLLYKDVIIQTNKNISLTEFYILNIKNKYSITFNKNTKLLDSEKNEIYNLLYNFSKKINNEEQKYIKELITYNNQEISTISKLTNIDRKKRTKIILLS